MSKAKQCTPKQEKLWLQAGKILTKHIKRLEAWLAYLTIRVPNLRIINNRQLRYHSSTRVIMWVGMCSRGTWWPRTTTPNTRVSSLRTRQPSLKRRAWLAPTLTIARMLSLANQTNALRTLALFKVLLENCLVEKIRTLTVFHTNLQRPLKTSAYFEKVTQKANEYKR